MAIKIMLTDPFPDLGELKEIPEVVEILSEKKEGVLNGTSGMVRQAVC
jgi:hypothetical protein